MNVDLEDVCVALAINASAVMGREGSDTADRKIAPAFDNYISSSHGSGTATNFKGTVLHDRDFDDDWHQ